MKSELTKEEELAVLENELEYLKTQLKNQKAVIEKRIYSEKREIIYSLYLLIRTGIVSVVLTALICLIYFLIKKNLGENPVMAVILVFAIVSILFYQTYSKVFRKSINDEVNRLTKLETKKPKVIKKFTTTEEAQRMKIIEEGIREREEKIESLKNKNKNTSFSIDLVK